MSSRNETDQFGIVVRDYLRGRISRRQFIIRGAQVGPVGGGARQADPAVPGGEPDRLRSPEAPYESPITPERVAFLKTKPYKGRPST